MKIITMAILASVLLVGVVGAEDVIELSAAARETTTPDVEPFEITYTIPVTEVTSADAVDVRTFGLGFGTTGARTTGTPFAITGPKPVSVTPSFSISVSNVTSSRVSTYTPSFAVGANLTRATPPILLFGGK